MTKQKNTMGIQLLEKKINHCQERRTIYEKKYFVDTYVVLYHPINGFDPAMLAD
jgi:hypothetical protein